MSDLIDLQDYLRLGASFTTTIFGWKIWYTIPEEFATLIDLDRANRVHAGEASVHGGHFPVPYLQ